MRKTIAIMMAAALMGSVTGCAGKTTTETTTAVETTTQESSNQTESTTEESTTQETTTKESDKADDGLVQAVTLEAIHTAIKKAYGDDYIPSAPFDQAALENMFGVKSDMYDDFIAEGPMISVNVETFVAIQAKDGQAEAVEAALNDYRHRLLEDTMQYPMNLVKIQASQVVRQDNFVFFIMLGAPTMEAEESGEDAALKSAQENNEIALNVIDSFFE